MAKTKKKNEKKRAGVARKAAGRAARAARGGAASAAGGAPTSSWRLAFGRGGRRARAGAILQGLGQGYPEANCELVHKSPFELLISPILSAQCPDVTVNLVTKDLFP